MKEVIGWAVLDKNGNILAWFKTRETAISWGELKPSREFNICQAYAPKFTFEG